MSLHLKLEPAVRTINFVGPRTTLGKKIEILRSSTSNRVTLAAKRNCHLIDHLTRDKNISLNLLVSLLLFCSLATIVFLLF